MNRFSTVLILVALATLTLGAAVVRADDAFDREVERAIDAGTEFLLSVLRGEAKGPDGKPVGTWTAVEGYPMGCAAIQVYALVKSDIPISHPIVKEGLKRLSGMPFAKTYSVALYIMALDAVLTQMDVERSLGGAPSRSVAREVRDKMESATQWLIRARLQGEGAWNYGADRAGTRYDHSNTQFAILALGVAYKRRIKIPSEVWQEIAAHFIRTQQEKIEMLTAQLAEMRAQFETYQRRSSTDEVAPIRAARDIKAPRLIKKVNAVYPEIARQAKVEGVVILEVTTDIYGRVDRVKVLRSIPLLDQAAVDAVRQWIYEPKLVGGEPRAITFTVTIQFKEDMETDASGISGGVTGGVVGGVAGGVEGEVAGGVAGGVTGGVVGGVKGGVVGGAKPPKLIKMVEPVYPEEAEKAGIEGIVILELKVDTHGRVKDVKVLRSIPELDQAAIDAVKQWIYEPPTVDGKPLENTLTVTVRFTKDEETDVIR